MAIGRIKYKQPKSVKKGASDVDNYVNINLESESKLLPPDNINKVVDLGDVFNKEREESKRYRFVGTLLPVFTNVLFNISGDKGPSSFNIFQYNNWVDTTLLQQPSEPDAISYDKSYGWETFDGYTFKTDPFDNSYVGRPDFTYTESINKNLKEINGWFGFYDPDFRKVGFCDFYDLEPRRDRFDPSSSLSVRNWEFTITYPYATDDQNHLVKGGLLITNAEVRILGGVPMVVFGTAAPHNLQIGDTVRISDISNLVMNGDFTVQSVGLENGDSKDTFFVVDINPTLATLGPIFSGGRMKRLYYGNEVTYYLRKFKKIKKFETQTQLTPDDYEVYPLAFSLNIYNDPNYQIVIKDDIDISDLKDNLGRPLSEIYLTMVKSKSDNMFTRTQSGFDFENYYGNTITNTTDGRAVSNIRKIHTLSAPLAPFDSHTPIEDNVLISNNDYYGDICEYSKYEVKETILQKIMHRFNTVDRETTVIKQITDSAIYGPRPEGYIYYPHYQVNIRQFSNYVEQGDSTTVGIPEYAESLGDGRYLWRDLLTLGYNDGQDETLDYPFLNGSHYLYDNFCIVTRRQDPFGVFGLYYVDKYPRDIFGDGLPDKFEVKRAADEC
jgi:hypothetical protein